MLLSQFSCFECILINKASFLFGIFTSSSVLMGTISFQHCPMIGTFLKHTCTNTFKILYCNKVSVPKIGDRTRVYVYMCDLCYYVYCTVTTVTVQILNFLYNFINLVETWKIHPTKKPQLADQPQTLNSEISYLKLTSTYVDLFALSLSWKVKFWGKPPNRDCSRQIAPTRYCVSRTITT